MALITSDCGTARYLSTKRPESPLRALPPQEDMMGLGLDKKDMDVDELFEKMDKVIMYISYSCHHSCALSGGHVEHSRSPRNVEHSCSMNAPRNVEHCGAFIEHLQRPASS